MNLTRKSSGIRKSAIGSNACSREQIRVALHVLLLIGVTCAPAIAGHKRRVLQTASTSVNFGNVQVGTSSTQVVTYNNTGNENVNVSSVIVAGPGFAYSGPALPLSVPRGQSVTLSIVFSPSVVGASIGTLAVSDNAISEPAVLPLTGSGIQQTPPPPPSLSVNPASVSFGNVVVGSSTSATVSLANAGTSPVNISQAALAGTGFTTSGLTMPLTLGPSQSSSFTVNFLPATAGTAIGNISVVSDAANSPATIALNGAGTPPPPSLSVNPASVSFGNVVVGSSTSQTVSLVNAGTSPVNISQAAVTGAGLSLGAMAMPLTIGPNQSSSLTVNFLPATAGTASGSISVVSNAANSPATITLSGVGTQPQISVVPSNVNFGTLSVGLTNSQMVTLNNPGTANLSITQSAGPSSGFSTSGLATPMTIAPGKSTTFTVNFTPASTGTVTSSVVLVSNAPNSPTPVAVSGTGAASVNQISASSASLNFGTQTVGTSSAQNVTLTNTGTVSLSISQINVSPSSFTATGLKFPVTLSAGQSTTFSVTFAPTVAGSVTGTTSVISTATNSPLSISLSGSGAQTPHSVALNWTASTSTVVGYYVYCGTQASGPYTRLNSTPVPNTDYTENSVQSGWTYYYLVTAVDSNGVESAYSNEVSANIP